MDYATETLREVGEWPGAAVSFDTTKRHNVAVLSFGGQQRRVVFAATPSDTVRGLQNHIGIVRQELRGLGASRRKQQPSPHKDRQRNKPVRCLIPNDHPAPILPDHTTVLAKIKEMIMASVTQITPSGNAPAGTVHWLNECIERGKRGVFSEVVTVSPGLAAELLRRNEGNRNIRPVKATHYAADMAAGRWVFNGEAVIVSDTGELNDGQHRMQAIVDANLSIPLLVVFGVPRATRSTVDQGTARTASDYLAMDDVKNAAAAAGIARVVMAYERQDGRGIGTMRDFTNAEVVRRVRADNEIIVAAEYAQRVAKYCKRLLVPSLSGSCFYLMSEVCPQDARTYLDQVCVGENIKRGDPAFAVRSALDNVPGTARAVRLEVVFRGWNAFRQGRKLTLAKAMGNLPALV